MLVLLIAGTDLEVGVGFANATGEELKAAAVAAVGHATATMRSEPRLCISFTTLQQNPSIELEAVVSALGTPSIPAFGGAAACEYGDGLYTEVFFGTEAHPGAFVVLLLGGRIRHAHAVGCGWSPVGATYMVTQVQSRSLVVEIVGKPAIDIDRNYLGAPGGFGAMFVHHPLEVAVGGGCVLRVAYGAGPVPGSLFVDGDIEEGASVRLTEFSRTEVLEATREAMSKALAAWHGDSPGVARVFACSSRRFALGTWLERASEVVCDTLPAATQIVGMHALGEFAPMVDGEASGVHNGCIVVLL